MSFLCLNLSADEPTDLFFEISTYIHMNINFSYVECEFYFFHKLLSRWLYKYRLICLLIFKKRISVRWPLRKQF